MGQAQNKATHIPVRIRVGDKMYSIEVVEAMQRKAMMGRVYYDTQRIEIGASSNVTGRKFTDDEMSDTFWHELVHAILYDMGHRLYRSERFVNDFAHRLNQAIKSAKFK